MSKFNDIEKDIYFNKLKGLVAFSGLSKVEGILFLSAFEGWYYFCSPDIYQNLVTAAISTLEDLTNEGL